MSHDQADRKLVYMANQIATFFASFDESDAVDHIEDHIRKFWDPRMRSKITNLAPADRSGLTARAAAAISRLSSETPASTGRPPSS